MTFARAPLLIGQDWTGNPLALDMGPFAYAMAGVLTLLVFVITTADRKKVPGTVKELVVMAVMTGLIIASDGGLWVFH